MLRHFLRADLQMAAASASCCGCAGAWRAASTPTRAHAQSSRHRRGAPRGIQRVGMAHTAVVEIRHRRKLAAIKKTAHEDKRRRRDRTAAPVLRDQVMRIESVRRTDHLAPLPKMARRRIGTIRDQVVPIRASILATNYNAQTKSNPPGYRFLGSQSTGTSPAKHRHSPTACAQLSATNW